MTTEGPKKPTGPDPEIQPDAPAPLFRLVPRPRPAPEEAEAEFKRQFGDIPPPTPDMDPPEDIEQRTKVEALRATEATIDLEHQWARFAAPEMPARVGNPEAIVAARTAWREPMVLLTGPSGAGKTSLAVAMLRVWVSQHSRAGGFFHAILVGAAGIRHPAGHGEPELVAQAKRLPCIVLDDIGSERDTSTNDIPEIILVRHSQRLATFVTTGLTRAQLAARYGDGIARRLTERSMVLKFGPLPAAPPKGPGKPPP